MKSDEKKKKLIEIIYKHALKNAFDYGKANSKAVAGKVIREFPEARARIKQIISEINSIVSEVNKKSREEIKKELEKFEFEEKGKKEKKLEALPNAEKGRVKLRFAPNPSGALHIGHARAAVLNDEYAKAYNGKLVLRIEDTDPKRILPEAYDMIKEDLTWLGIRWHEEYLQSQRLARYYERAQQLIEKGSAYVCKCREDKFRELRNAGKPCKCRAKSIEENLEDFEKMKNEYREGEAVLRLKTNLKHENVSVRDFPIMRIVEGRHPIVGEKRLYPLMNFSVAVDDHELGITHVLRGKDHIINTEKQSIIFEYFRWKKPEYIHYGLLSIGNTILSTSEIKKGIESGLFSGWEDVRLGTLRALRRRGITSEAIRRAMLEVGVKSTDIKFSWENLYAYNKDAVDSKARRYFFVFNPKRVVVKNSVKMHVKLKLHPSVDYGFREFDIPEGEAAFLISEDDFIELREGEEIRLMGVYNIKILRKDKKRGIANADFLNTDLRFARDKKLKMVSWVIESRAVECEIISPEKNFAGLCEDSIINESIDRIIQFERFGFARIEEIEKEKIKAIFAHR